MADATGIRQYAGSAVQSALPAGITNTSGNFPITPTTGWPDGSIGNFTVTLDPGLSSEEKCLASGLAGGVLTILTRGYDGTVAVAHGSGAVVIHTISAIDLAEANYIANTHSQTSKATPVDADEIGLFDSAASFGLKKLTIANLKALVATYLASLVQVLTNKDLSSPTNIFPAQIVAGKNAIINGAMDIWQRGTSFTDTTSSIQANCADRWSAYTGTTGFTITQQASDLTGFQYYLRYQRNAGITSTNGQYLNQYIETKNALQFANKVVILSFKGRAGANFSGALNAQIRTSTTVDGNIFGTFAGSLTPINQSVTLTTSWQIFSVSGTIDVGAKTIAVSFSTTGSGTAGANDYFEITGIQLELGSVAATFSRNGANIAAELATANRYLPNFIGIGDEIEGFAISATQSRFSIPLSTVARLAATGITVSNVSHFTIDNQALGTGTPTVIAFNSAGNNTLTVLVTTTAASPTLVTGQPVLLIINNAAGSILGTGVEL